MTYIFDILSRLANKNNVKYREICVDILGWLIKAKPIWLTKISVRWNTDEDCKTFEELLEYMKWFKNKLEIYLGIIKDEKEIKEIQKIDKFKFLAWTLNDPYYERTQFPFIDNLHDIAHGLARAREIETDGSLLPDDIYDKIERWGRIYNL